TAAAHVLNWGEVSACMNPGRGRVWIAGKPESQPDGTRIDLNVLCLREEGPWKCEVLSQRRYEFSVPVSGQEQKFRLDIPLQLDAGEARAFAALAFGKGAMISVIDACGARADEPRDPRDDEYDRDLHSTFAPRGQPVDGSIDVTDQGMNF